MSETFEVLVPLARKREVAMAPKPYAPRAATLAGKRIGLVNNSKSMAFPTLEVVKEKLASRFPDAKFSYFATPTFVLSERDLEEVKKWASREADVVIGAMGD
ncbi:MAG: hypothetical protein RMJ15_10695 [Nitrososphaerota archaeon]|nr:hypothetical protein [Candidatus Bathyarchaeota archaeon]MDW8024178.1 hypothetical protein [Nitrososphaerota archaeon]